jgi:hypothetical protein
MPTDKSPDPAIVTAKDAYPTLRKFWIYAVISGLALSPLIPVPLYKVGLLIALGNLLLYLLFDIYNQLHARLTTIESCVLVPRPPRFSDYREAEDKIYQAIETALVEAPGVELHFLTVSGSYSWPFFEDAIRRLDTKFGTSKKIIVTFCMVAPSHFDQWSLLNWKRKAEVTIGSIEAFKRRYASRIEQRNIIIETYLFDNLPHWHGVLVDNNTLFMGRTEWELPPEGADTPPELLIGQIEYRKFTRADRFGGAERIARFKNWIERYKARRTEATLT